MIEKLKDFWKIFKNSIHEFYKEKHKALELLERVKYLRSYTAAVLGKNKEILKYLDANISNYPKCMHSCINDLVSLFQYGSDSKTITSTTSYLIYILTNINSKCCIAYNSMNEKFKKRNFAAMKYDYENLIKDLRWYEKRYDMIILDYFYDYDKV